LIKYGIEYSLKYSIDFHPNDIVSKLDTAPFGQESIGQMSFSQHVMVIMTVGLKLGNGGIRLGINYSVSKKTKSNRIPKILDY
jgi:hypothetical protein